MPHACNVSHDTSGDISRDATRKELGTYGEKIACSYIQELGWEILATNWRCRYGEIDIIARCDYAHGSLEKEEPAPTSANDTTTTPSSNPPLTRDFPTSLLVFIEVKTRRSEVYGSPCESITRQKCAHLRKAALSWLSAQHHKGPSLIRFDAIGIIVQNDIITTLTHIRRII